MCGPPYSLHSSQSEAGTDVKVVEDDVLSPSYSPSSPPPSAKVGGQAHPLLRHLSSAAPGASSISTSTPRNHLLSLSHALNPSATGPDGTLSLTGYLRGSGSLDVNGLVHVAELGTFRIASAVIEKGRGEGHAVEPKEEVRGWGGRLRGGAVLGDDDENANPTLSFAESPLPTVTPFLTAPMQPQPCDSLRSSQASLDRFARPDALDGEQNLVGFDDDEGMGDYDDEEGEEEEKGEKRREGHM